MFPKCTATPTRRARCFLATRRPRRRWNLLRTTKPISFEFGSDGSGYQVIYVPAGGSRNPVDASSFQKAELEERRLAERDGCGARRRGDHQFHDARGAAFPFGDCSNLPAIPSPMWTPTSSIRPTSSSTARSPGSSAIKSDKAPTTLYDFGNTSSATIPLTITANLRERIAAGPLKLVMSGFGVGLSWASTYWETENVVCPAARRGMNNPFSLIGRTVLVTGATAGLGRNTAIHAARMGATLVDHGSQRRAPRRDAWRSSRAKDIARSPPISRIKRRAKSLAAELPALDGVVHCAGLTLLHPFKFIDEARYRDIYAINVEAPLFLTQRLYKARKLKPRGLDRFHLLDRRRVSAPRATRSTLARKARSYGISRVLAHELAPAKDPRRIRSRRRW